MPTSLHGLGCNIAAGRQLSLELPDAAVELDPLLCEARAPLCMKGAKQKSFKVWQPTLTHTPFSFALFYSPPSSFHGHPDKPYILNARLCGKVSFGNNNGHGVSMLTCQFFRLVLGVFFI